MDNNCLDVNNIENQKNSANKKEIKNIYISSLCSTIVFVLEIFILAFLIIYVVTAKVNNLTTNYEETIRIVLKILAAIEIVRIIFLLLTLIFIFVCRDNDIKSRLFALAIISLIPAISFISFFFLKRRIKKIYVESLDN